jgi:hypothetical protein
MSLTTFTDVLGNTVPDIHSTPGDYSSDAIGAGVKARIKGPLILTGNVTIRIDSAGLTDRVVPLVGLSYAFK